MLPFVLTTCPAGIPVFLSIVLRYLRITPLLAFLLGVYACLLKYIGDGPLWFRCVRHELG